MANYSLVINSKFQPFSFERYIQPYQIYGQAYREQEDALSELATKASIWDKMTNAETDKKAHAMYEAYARDLEEQASQLSKHGLNPSSRQQMLKMRSRYSSDIVPIEQAYKRREEQAKRQAEIMANDPTHFFARMASTTSLDDYIANPSLDTLSQNYSGALLTQQVSQAAAALAKDARNDPNVRTELRKLLPYQYETIRRTGFDPNTVMQAILNSPDANKILTGIVDTAMTNSGMNNWNYMSPEDRERILTQARNYASQGLWSAVGQTQYGNVTDQYGMNVAMESLRHRNAMEEIRERAKPTTPPEESNRGWNFLETNGDLAYYDDLKSKLTTKGGGLSTSYFGDKNKRYVNPIKVYEDVMKEFSKIQKASSGAAAHASPAAMADAKNTEQVYIAKAREKALEKYGVKDILSPQEYKYLKELGYTDQSTFSDFRNTYDRRVNEKASQWRHGSVNLPAEALDVVGDTFTDMLNFHEEQGTKAMFYEMNKDGSIGKNIQPDDLELTKDNKGRINGKLTDIYYSRQAPRLLHVTYDKNNFYSNPSAFSDVMSNVVNYTAHLLESSDDNLIRWAKSQGTDVRGVTAEDLRNRIAKNAENMIRDVARGYNQGVPKINSELLKVK